MTFSSFKTFADLRTHFRQVAVASLFSGDFTELAGRMADAGNAFGLDEYDRPVGERTMGGGSVEIESYEELRSHVARALVDEILDGKLERGVDQALKIAALFGFQNGGKLRTKPSRPTE